MGNGANNGGGQQNNAVHSVLLAAVGAYVVYLAYGIIKNALEGDPTMPLTVAIPIGILFGIAGAAVVAYAALLWFRQSKNAAATDDAVMEDEEASEEDTPEDDALEEGEPEEEEEAEGPEE